MRTVQEQWAYSSRRLAPLGIWVLILAAAISVGMITLMARAQQPTGVAELKDEAGKTIGQATFTQDLPGGGVWIRVQVSGLTPGVHGIHVHAVGTCIAPGFMSAAGHFNPGGQKHGFLNAEGTHAGDLPNMIVPAAGATRYETANFRFTLGPGTNTLFDADGSALVIHALPDDYSTDPAGNSGGRVACGVISRVQ